MFFTHFKGYELWNKPQDGNWNEDFVLPPLYFQGAFFMQWDAFPWCHDMNAIAIIEKKLEVWDYKSKFSSYKNQHFLSWGQHQKKSGKHLG